MRKILLTSILFISFCITQTFSQTRYLDSTYFSNFTVDTLQLYGANDDFMGTPTNLYYDIYQPVGDTVTSRPLIIWMHGGGYTTGTRHEGYLRNWCRQFAKRGYVAVSIDYRLGTGGGMDGKIKAIYRAVQDAKAAIRYFREYADSFDIDTNKIVLAGSSVGGFTAIHAAYWDTDELPAAIDTNVLGNLEGASGNPGHSSLVNAVVNFWGAIKDSTWIDAGEPMIVSCHGVMDDVVYPETQVLPLSGIEFGSRVVDRVAKSQNIPDTLKMFSEAGHALVGTAGTQAPRFDTATYFAAEFLYCNLITSCAVSSINDELENMTVILYPNPVSDKVTIETNGFPVSEIRLYDVRGVFIKSVPNPEKKIKISLDLSDLSSGMYFIEIGSIRKKIIRQ